MGTSIISNAWQVKRDSIQTHLQTHVSNITARQFSSYVDILSASPIDLTINQVLETAELLATKQAEILQVTKQVNAIPKQPQLIIAN
ncbi:MAG: hypothetical protein AB8B89_04195 [Gammaproteobacteria bacterium]